jgi:hypothetical protein
MAGISERVSQSASPNYGRSLKLRLTMSYRGMNRTFIHSLALIRERQHDEMFSSCVGTLPISAGCWSDEDS